MKFEKAQVIEDDNGTEYVVMSVIQDSSKEYAFANKFDKNNEPTEEYRVFTLVDDELEIVEDSDLINKLLPTFQKNIVEDLKEMLN